MTTNAAGSALGVACDIALDWAQAAREVERLQRIDQRSAPEVGTSTAGA
jgi:hypothetical protein